MSLSILAATVALFAPLDGEVPIVFTTETGAEVQAYRGTLEVPEHRADAASRMITLSYVRFPATTAAPGDPIVYLAGGPGGSGSRTAAGRRFPLFMAMRAHGDVIGFVMRDESKLKHAGHAAALLAQSLVQFGLHLLGRSLEMQLVFDGGDFLERLLHG